MGGLAENLEAQNMDNISAICTISVLPCNIMKTAYVPFGLFAAIDVEVFAAMSRYTLPLGNKFLVVEKDVAVTACSFSSLDSECESLWQIRI